ncbi:MAG: hypothetical protein Q9M94_01565 [Candidatus Gracilibacteria bacterium]|nr:hypothetical protein [Candidatus Gracilibacteria bacterium]MDQ7023433.1 hypothetical protein [Candidatus Gracilibacteria bacterium]
MNGKNNFLYIKTFSNKRIKLDDNEKILIEKIIEAISNDTGFTIKNIEESIFNSDKIKISQRDINSYWIIIGAMQFNLKNNNITVNNINNAITSSSTVDEIDITDKKIIKFLINILSNIIKK